MTNKSKISRAEISQEYGLSEWCVKVTATKYGLEVVDHDGREFLYDREDTMEVFGGALQAEERQQERGVPTAENMHKTYAKTAYFRHFCGQLCCPL